MLEAKRATGSGHRMPPPLDAIDGGPRGVGAAVGQQHAQRFDEKRRQAARLERGELAQPEGHGRALKGPACRGARRGTCMTSEGHYETTASGASVEVGVDPRRPASASSIRSLIVAMRSVQS